MARIQYICVDSGVYAEEFVLTSPPYEGVKIILIFEEMPIIGCCGKKARAPRYSEDIDVFLGFEENIEALNSLVA